MFDENSILDAKNVRSNPVRRDAVTGKSAMHDNEISFGHNRSMFIVQGWRDSLDEVERAVAARRDMRAVLNVVGRPLALSRCVVTFVKQRVKSLKNECFVFFLQSTDSCSFSKFTRIFRSSPDTHFWAPRTFAIQMAYCYNLF
jgi:hypothetical protein